MGSPIMHWRCGMLALLLCIACNTNSVLGDWDYQGQFNPNSISIFQTANKIGMASSNLKVVSFNAQGLQGHKKRNKVFHWLKKKKANVLLLQETHSTPEVIEKWNSQWGGETYYSHGNTESRGVAIFIDKHFDYTVNACHRDKEGRYVILDLEVYHQRTIIVNIYAPNQDDPSFFINVLAKLDDIGCENVIWGGDFNFVFQPDIDKEGGTNQTHFKCRKVVIDWMVDREYIDIWRVQHEGLRKYTWFSHPRVKGGKKRNMCDPGAQNVPNYEIIACRLDFFLIPSNFQQNTVYTSIISGFHSDHNMVTMSLRFDNYQRGRGFWKINCSLLEEPDYINMINSTIDNTVTENPDTNDSLLWEQVKCNIRRDTISYGHRKAKANRETLSCLESRKFELQHALTQAYDEETILELGKIRQEIDVIINHKVEGAAM